MDRRTALWVALAVVAAWILWRILNRRPAPVIGHVPYGPSDRSLGAGAAAQAASDALRIDDIIAGPVSDSEHDWFLEDFINGDCIHLKGGGTLTSHQGDLNIGPRTDQVVDPVCTHANMVERITKLRHQLIDPAARCPLSALTKDDFSLALKFLAGQLNAKGCPQTPDQKRIQDLADTAGTVVDVLGGIVGGVLSIVKAVIGTDVGLGALANWATSYGHGGINDYVAALAAGGADVAYVLKLGQNDQLGLGREPYQMPDGLQYIRTNLFWSGWGNKGGWRFGWLSQELGCTSSGLRARVVKRARLLRALDVLACTTWPEEVLTTDQAGVLVRTSPPGTYRYRNPTYGKLWGSIFPPDLADGDEPLQPEASDHGGNVVIGGAIAIDPGKVNATLGQDKQAEAAKAAVSIGAGVGGVDSAPQSPPPQVVIDGGSAAVAQRRGAALAGRF